MGALALAVAFLPGTVGGQAAGGKGGVLAPAPSPVELTASDGAGLALVSLTADAVIEDPLAFTELHLVFQNPEDRVREGRFRITLPQGAVVSRFAMRIGNAWQEGEVVERQAARQAYEDFLHRRQDPALLETEAGNEFSARVFPIPPRATKEIILSYSQELVRSAEPYRLPLRGLPKMGTLTVRALVARSPVVAAIGATASVSTLGGQRTRHEVIEVKKTDFLPDRDFEIADRGAARHAGLRHDNLVVARVQPLGGVDKPSPIESLFVLVDTSASRALGFDDQVARVDELLAVLSGNGDPRVAVAAFDQDVEPLFSGQASGFAKGGRARLLAREALGASDIDRALGWLATTLKKAPRYQRVLLVTDAVATAGETASDKLQPKVKALAEVGVERLDVIGMGGIRDDELARRLVRAGLAQDGLVLDGALPARALAQRLARATRSGIKVAVAGSRWVWPQVLDGVQAGDEVLVYADAPGATSIQLTLDGAPAALPASGIETVEQPLLERAWVKARMSRLLEQRDAAAASDPDMAEALKKQVLELSVRHRVLCPLTALLVLETERDYARFNIERRGLADILTVGPGGITVLSRKDAAFTVQQPPPAEREWQDASRRPLKTAEQPARPAASAPVTRGIPDPGDRVATVERLAQARSDEERGLAAQVESAARSSEGATGRRARTAAKASSSSAPPSGNEGKPSRGSLDDLLDSAMSARARPGSDASPRPSAGGRVAAAEPPPPAASAVPPPASSPAPPAPKPPAERRMSAPPPQLASPPPPSQAPVPMGGRRMAEIATSAPPPVAPYTGGLADVMDLLARGRRGEALTRAAAWRKRDPGDALALVALGEALEATGDPARAGRAYGSLIDLFPSRADLRRFAGGRLERIGQSVLALAIDSFRKAVEQRPDHPASHRMLAFALLKAGRPAEAFDALMAAVGRGYPSGRFNGVEQILREDLGLAAAAWRQAEPRRAAEIDERLRQSRGVPEGSPSVRFVLTWETDANDVDFHVRDGAGGHAFYSQRALPSGGSLYADVTTGYGPECFTIRGAASSRAYPYRLQAHYYRRGPMGYGMGKLQIIEHDGRGHLRFQERPFVVMQDNAYVDLGVFTGALPR